ncbi:hypothetical protein AND_005423 [Anopheles darlingi]|uniref:Uncharacterized protein n=1 Tax=Anopheles darlingi TaxID=43151 RepID=W5JJ95_ANODA|nr:hypothetical protein AND_005423 [Anopheles darlingi]
MTQRAATQRASGPASDVDSTVDAMAGGGASSGAGAGGGGGPSCVAASERRDTKVDIPLPAYMIPSGEKFADKRVKTETVYDPDEHPVYQWRFQATTTTGGGDGNDWESLTTP